MGVWDTVKKAIKRFIHIPETIIEGMQKKQEDMQKKDHEKWVREKRKK